MNTLPTEILQLILYNITNILDYKRASIICKKWWKILKQNAVNVANENTYPFITYLPFDNTIFPSWTTKDLQCITNKLKSGLLHGEQIVNVTGYESILFEANWIFGNLHGLVTSWQITANSHTIYIKHGKLKLKDRHTTNLHFSRQPLHICNYNYGKKHGNEIKFNIDAEFIYSCEWQHGIKHGEEIIVKNNITTHNIYILGNLVDYYLS